MSAFSPTTPRSKGNELYIMSTNKDSEGNHLWKIANLTEAIRNFEEGKRVASRTGDKSEWLKCARSLGVTYSYLASSKECQDGKGIDWTVYNFKSALTAFSEIMSNHRNIEDKAWQNIVFNKLCSTISAAIEYCTSDDTCWQKRCSLLEKLLHLEEVSGGSACYTRVQVLVSTADEIVKAMVVADEAGEWRTVLALVGELNRPLSLTRTELRKCLSVLPPLAAVELSDLDDRLTEIEGTQQYYWGRGSSQQHRMLGESFFRQMVFDEEALDTELLWVCVDHLSASMQCLRGADGNPEACSCHESFAKSCSALGLVYEKVLKMSEKAHGLYLQTILHCDIVTHTSGAQFFSKDWYQAAKTGVEAHRRRREAYNSAEVAKQREPTLVALKPTLTAIDAAIATCESKQFKGHALLVHLYAKVPPKNGAVLAAALNRDSKEDMKKAFLKAVTHYHPDKKCNKENGIEWLVLCEEITKRLNEYYEVVK